MFLILNLFVLCALSEKLPNIGYIGRGYDLVYGNPLATTDNANFGVDPGLRTGAIFELFYNEHRTTPDGRHEIPDNVDVIMDLSCNCDVSSNETFGQTSYVEKLKNSISVKGSYLAGSFTGSADFQSTTQTTEISHQVIVSTRSQCSVYSATFLPYLKYTLSQNFLGGVTSLLEDKEEVYQAFVDFFGTHVTTQINMGAYYAIHSMLSQSNYSWYTTNHQDISVSADASYKIMSGHISGMSSQDIARGKDFASRVERMTKTSFGTMMAPDQTCDNWKDKTLDSPSPLRYHVMPILDLISTMHLPHLPENNITFIYQRLNVFYQQYCDKYVKNCHIHPDPKYRTFTMVQSEGTGNVNVVCPAGTQLISVGTIIKDWNNPEYRPQHYIMHNYDGACYNSFGIICRGLCLSTDGTHEQTALYLEQSGVKPTVSCPTGYVASDCRMSIIFDQANWGETPWFTMIADKTQIGAQQGCYCEAIDLVELGFKRDLQVRCQATCMINGDYVSVQQIGRGLVLARCAPEYKVVGCAYSSKGDERYFYAYPDSEINGCACYNYAENGSVGCIANCLRL